MKASIMESQAMKQKAMAVQLMGRQSMQQERMKASIMESQATKQKAMAA